MLSIVVPVYNTSQYLSNCVNSILKQTYKDFELILVNDGSTDDSGELCDNLKKIDSRIKVIHKENGGLISAWKKGVIEATKDYIGFIDSDDYIADNYFEVLMEPILKYKCEVSICGYTINDTEKKEIFPTDIALDGLFKEKELEYIKNNFYHQINILNSRVIKVFEKKLLLKNFKFLNEKISLGEDKTITVPCILDAQSVYINNKYFGYYYRIGNNSMSHLFNFRLINNFELLYENIINSFIMKGYINEYVYIDLEKNFISVIGLIIFSNEKLKNKVSYLKKFRSLECSEILLKYPLEEEKFSWKIIRILVKIKAFYLMCLLAKCKSII